MTAELIQYDAMCRAINAAYEVDEVKEIHDKAVAMEAYFRQAKNPEPERRACEIRLRSERKAGQLLKKLEKAKGGQPYQSSGTTGSTEPIRIYPPVRLRAAAICGCSGSGFLACRKYASIATVKATEACPRSLETDAARRRSSAAAAWL